MYVEKTPVLSMLYGLSLAATVTAGGHVCVQNKIKGPTIHSEPDSFMELVEKSSIFIDKSLFIQEFLDSSSYISWMAYPRKWGKTMNMRMLECFLQVGVDSEGNQIHPETTAAFKLFALGVTPSGDDIHMNIAQHKGVIEKYLSRYPVIYVSFKDVQGSKYEEILTDMKHAIAEAYEKHSYMVKVFEAKIKNDIPGSKPSLKHFQRILSSTADEPTTEYSIEFLSGILKEHFGKDVFIFLDDVDRPFHSVQSTDFDKVHTFMANLMTTAYSRNPNLERGFMTGVYRVFDEKMLSNLIKFDSYNMLQRKFADYYGFTEGEVDALFEHFKINAQLTETAKKLYKGYVVVDDSTLVYSPWDIVEFLHSGNVSNYWVELVSGYFPQVFFKIEGVESSVVSLLNNENNWIIDKFTLLKFKEAVEHSEVSDYLISDFLFATGYLSLIESAKMDENKRMPVRLANAEIVTEMTQRLLQYYLDAYRVPIDIRNQVATEIERLPTTNDTAPFNKALANLLRFIPQFKGPLKGKPFDIALYNYDIVYSAFNLLMLITKQTHQPDEIYLFARDRTVASNGRPSIMWAFKELGIGTVIELKYNSTAIKALDQAENHAKMFDKIDHIHKVRLMVVNVYPNKTVEINDRWKKIK